MTYVEYFIRARKNQITPPRTTRPTITAIASKIPPAMVHILLAPPRVSYGLLCGIARSRAVVRTDVGSTLGDVSANVCRTSPSRSRNQQQYRKNLHSPSRIRPQDAAMPAAFSNRQETL